MHVADELCKDIDLYAAWVDSRWSGNEEDKLTLKDHFIMATGLPGETGEVCEMLKKWQRDDVLDIPLLTKELGDVVYYIVRIATAHGVKASEVLKMNYIKIEDRIERGVLHGSGNER